MKRSGKPAGEDFADNRVPGKGQKKVRKNLTAVTELDNQGALIRTPRDRVDGPSGRRGIVKPFRRPPTGRLRDPQGGLPIGGTPKTCSRRARR